MTKSIFFLTVSLFLIRLNVYAQNAIDTIYSSHGTVVLFDDRSWQYLDDLDFDGILNPHLHNLVSSLTDLELIQSWDTEVCYTSDRQNDLSKLKDTLWLCVNDDERNGFKMPFEGLVTSRYGYRKGRYHNGIDIDLEVGDVVRSCWAGKVRYAKFNEGGFGNLVIVRHYNGLETFYAHLSKLSVVPNQEVEAGQELGLGGNTGHSRGSHLHFEVRFYDAPMNPEEIIDFAAKSIKQENLFVYKELFRPGAKPSDHEEHGETYTSNVASTSQSSKYYKIKSGDTLGRIASRNGTTVSRLCKLNGIRPTTSLQIGRTLRIR